MGPEIRIGLGHLNQQNLDQNAGCPATWKTWTCEGITILKYSLQEKLNWDFYIGLNRVGILWAMACT